MRSAQRFGFDDTQKMLTIVFKSKRIGLRKKNLIHVAVDFILRIKVEARYARDLERLAKDFSEKPQKEAFG